MKIGISNPKDQEYMTDFTSFFEETKGDNKIASKLLKSLLKSNALNLIVSTIMFIIKHCAVWIIPIVTSNIIDIVTYPKENSMSLIFINGAILVIAILQNVVTHVWYADFNSCFLRKIVNGIRNSLVKKLQQLSLTYHNELKSGVLQSKFIRDTEAIELFISQILSSLIPAVLTIIVTAFLTIKKSLIVTLFFILMIPINLIIVNLFNGKIKKRNTAFRKENEAFSTDITTMIEMIPVTKAHGLEEEEIKKIQNDLKKLMKEGRLLDHSTAQFGSWSWAVGMCMNAICLIFTGYLAYIGKISVGNVVLFQSYFSTITGNIQALLNIYPQFVKGFESVNSISEIMVSDRTEDNKGKIRLRYVHGTVQFKNVTYKYPGSEKKVIDNISFNALPGDCVAVVGSSGSGKSTMMNMIIGALESTDGDVYIDGKPIKELDLSSYRKFISVVPQNCILFSGTIKENILYGINKCSDEDFEKILDLANIREFIDKLPDGVNTMVEEHGGNLSGGQKQRISIARAFIRDPKIIILDEATSALDNISEMHIQKALSNLVKGRTTFIVAHRLSTIRDANKILVLENGKCVEEGTQEELMAKKGRFYELKSLMD